MGWDYFGKGLFWMGSQSQQNLPFIRSYLYHKGATLSVCISRIRLSVHSILKVFPFVRPFYTKIFPFVTKVIPFHRVQKSKQIDIAKYVSKFLIYGAKMLDKFVRSQKKIFVHCPFL